MKILSKFTKFSLSFLFATTILLSLRANQAFAASTILQTNPAGGSYNALFSVNVVIDGHGDAFNAAKAEVSVPQSLFIQELVLGDCNFSFTSTPSTSNPSFEGIILGGKSKKCTVYSLKLIPAKTEEAKIIFNNAAVLRYGDAVNVLSSVKNATFSITAIPNPPTPLPNSSSSEGASYSLEVTILTDRGEAASNIGVSIKTPDGSELSKKFSDTKGLVQFNELEKGIYSINVEAEKDNVQETIVNVSGKNQLISLSIKLKSNPAVLGLSSDSSLTPFIIGGSAILIMAILWLILRVRITKRKLKSQKTP